MVIETIRVMETRQPTSQYRPESPQHSPYGAPQEYFRRLGPDINEDGIGARLDGYVARKFPFLTRGGWQHRIFSGCLRVNSSRVDPGYRLVRGDKLTFFHPPSVEPEVDRGIFEIWRDGDIMAVFKPGNLPMHENGPYRFNTFTHLVHEKFGSDWSAVHRLDRETSGIVLCAATPAARKRLSAAWAARTVHKEYLAIVFGAPEEDHWIETGPIGDLSGSQIRIKKWVVPGGLAAETEFYTIARHTDRSLLRAVPRTGRTNQIRIHAAYAGHHLIGDKLYHPDESVFLEYFEHGNTPAVQERVGFSRLCLHAALLRFNHPFTDEMIEVESPLPDDMATCL